VKHHLTSVFGKTGTSTRLELALFAIRQGIVAGD
jgi:DNA-binding CsgD family transcriptional regulator